jgi:hypothetical protein
MALLIIHWAKLNQACAMNSAFLTELSTWELNLLMFEVVAVSRSVVRTLCVQ